MVPPTYHQWCPSLEGEQDLGVHISEDLSWVMNTTSLAKKAQSRLYFLRKLGKAWVPPRIMCPLYQGTSESILTSCITVWYGGCNGSFWKTLQRIVIIRVSLPSLVDIFHRLTSTAISIHLSLLPSWRRYQSLQAHSTRLSNSCLHQADKMLNSVYYLPPSPATTKL